MTDADAGLLPSIEDALARPDTYPVLDAGLRSLYDAEQDAGRRPYNRLVAGITIAIFDLFLVANMATVPDLAVLSAILRLGIITPIALAFIVLDWRGRLHRAYDPYLLILAVSTSAAAGALSILSHTPAALPDVQAMPLILLVTGMSWRMTPRAAAANALVSTAIYMAGEVLSPAVPRSQLGSMILTDIAICASCLMFTRRLDWRDRRVFLLNLNEKLRRALIAEQNSGLLREVQTDALTGVANRRCFDETLAASWQDAKRAGAPLALIMIDVDHFKRFNDHYGHQGGDDCLRRVAALLRGAARASDLVARYGGEEFAVIMPSATIGMAAEAAERLRLAVSDMHLRHEGMGSGTTVSVSLGVASATPGGEHSARRLIEVADRRLYAAKQAGRNRVGVTHEAGGQTMASLVAS